MRNFFCLTIFFVLLTGCSSLKTLHLLKTGEVVNRNYLVKIPIEIVHGEIIMTVNINGTNYRLAFDTGALNVLSEEVAQKLDLKIISNLKTTDSQGNDNTLKMTKLDRFYVGGLEYRNMGAAIYDLNKMQEITCFKIDGIFGANSMRESFWQVDMKNKEIRISNSLDSLKISRDAYIVPFTTEVTGTPIVKIEFNNEIFNDITFDYGSNAGLYLNSVKAVTDTVKYGKIVRSFGYNSYGLYGGESDTSYTFRTDTVKMGNCIITNPVITRNKVISNIIGTDILKKYIVTLDWVNKKVYMEEHKDFPEDEEDGISIFGITVRLQEGKLIVHQVYENSSAADAGISLGDQVISVNDNDLSNISMEEYCKIILNGLFAKDANSARVVIKNNNTEKEVILEKRTLL